MTIFEQFILWLGNLEWQSELIMEADLSLIKAVNMVLQWDMHGQSFERWNHINTMNIVPNMMETMNRNYYLLQKIHSGMNRQYNKPKTRCTRCGLNNKDRSKCPAYNTECRNCFKLNHWARCCKMKKRRFCSF